MAKRTDLPWVADDGKPCATRAEANRHDAVLALERWLMNVLDSAPENEDRRALLLEHMADEPAVVIALLRPLVLPGARRKRKDAGQTRGPRVQEAA